MKRVLCILVVLVLIIMIFRTFYYSSSDDPVPPVSLTDSLEMLGEIEVIDDIINNFLRFFNRIVGEFKDIRSDLRSVFSPIDAEGVWDYIVQSLERTYDLLTNMFIGIFRILGILLMPITFLLDVGLMLLGAFYDILRVFWYLLTNITLPVVDIDFYVTDYVVAFLDVF